MKLDVVMKALRQYILHNTDGVHDTIDAIRALEDCMATAERIDWDDYCAYVVPQQALDNILNTLTYDAYGMLARGNNNKVPFTTFVDRCRSICGVEYLPNHAFECIHSLFSDLWQDNEDGGCNTSLGTFLGCNTPDEFFKTANSCIEHLIRLTGIEDDDKLNSIKITINDEEYCFYDSAALVGELIDALQIAKDLL